MQSLLKRITSFLFSFPYYYFFFSLSFNYIVHYVQLFISLLIDWLIDMDMDIDHNSKYFVAEENLAEVVLKSVSELPILVYGRTGNLTGMEEEVASPITSVYFDNAEMEMYEERIARLEGAKLFRVRWYGPKPTGTQLFFCELKTHHNAESGQDSNKKRVEVQACDLEQLIDVQNHPWTDQEAKDVILRATPKKKKKHLKKAIKLLTQIQHLIVAMQLRPCVTTAYKRLALQSSHTNDLRMTIDRDVTMIDEYANALKPSSCKKSWCLAGEKLENIPAEAAVKIPYTIFEVKLMEGAAKPEHIQTFEDRDIMIVNGKFSKFITGAALHHMEDINVAPGTCFWFWFAFRSRSIFVCVCLILKFSTTHSFNSFLPSFILYFTIYQFQ